MRLSRLLSLPLLLCLPPLAGTPCLALAAQAPDLAGIAYEQRLGNQLPWHMFFDDTGRIVRLADITEGKPLVLVLGYFRCPGLCDVVRGDLFEALRASGLKAGTDYSLVALSIDASETSVDAAAAKAKDLRRYPAPGAANNWHYLTGAADTVQAMAEATGFRTRAEPARKTFAHPIGVIFATPAGLVSSYLFGVGYQPDDVRRAVTRAQFGGIASPASPILLLCFDYDPTIGRYTLAIMKLLRLTAAITLIAFAGALVLAFSNKRRA